MIVLTVLSHNGLPSNIPAVHLDEMGGTIGRADNNQLVLPDQDRTISRLHAQVVFRSGRYAVIDLGANAVMHNGQPIGHGREAPIQPGDELEIGGYKIAVANVAVAAAKADDPFAGFEGDIVGLPAPSLRSAPLHQTPVPFTPAPAVASLPAAPKSSLGGGIPDDWDPFLADRPGAHANTAPVALGSPEAAPFVAFGESSLDDLFGLGGGAPASAALPPVTRDDHASEMSVPWTGVFAKPKPETPPATLPLEDDDLLLGLAPQRVPSPAVPEAPQPKAALPKITVPEPALPQPTLPEDAQVLMDAFLQGLGVNGMRLRPVTAQSMHELGQMLREYTRGTMDLLVARGALKKEVRADVTMMAPSANNVLKFSPTVDFALQHLLGTRTPGFMGSLESLEDTFEDLKSHQLGVMAGMHAALQGVLKRFDPAEIERKVGNQGGLFSLVPSSKKAKLWELFQEMYGQSASQAREEFDDLFGKAFAREYDRFVSELSSK
jgi:type VI secretion system FHA domain protein